MNPGRQQEAEARKVYEKYWESYSKGDLEVFSSTLDEAFELIGTSESEVCHSKAEGIEFYKNQMQETVGRVEMRNRSISVKPVHGMFLVNEACDIYILNEPEWTFYSKIRLSTLLHETESGWKVIHQHGSFPDMRVQEGETMAFDKISKQNLELQDSIKRATVELENKNRELAIEAALEKVRAVAMGMKKPEDMLAICRTISEQLQLFGVTQIRNIQTALIDEEKGIYLCYQYFAPYDKEVVEKTEYLKSTVEHGMVRKMLASENAHFTNGLTGKELEEFREHRKAENHFPDPLLDEAKELSYCFLSIGQGGLGLTLYQSLDGATLDLFKRFHQVFSLAYQRFRDIKKSEAHAREIEIDLALERVRAQTMAMHNSEDVGKCIVKMFGELTALGVDEGTRFGIGILNEDNENIQLWTASKDGEEVKMHIGNLDMTLHPLLKSARKAWKEQVLLHQYVLEGEDLLNYYQMINNAPDYKLRIAIDKLPDREFHYGFVFDHGFFYAFSLREFQPELIQITQRFSSLFGQTYRRYLDLVKAEGQAREAEIELALERVRARTMAMQKSDELPEAANVLFQQLQSLGMPAWSAGYCTWNEDKSAVTLWMSSEGMLQPPFEAPTTEDELFIEMRKGQEDGKTFHVIEMGGDKLVKHYEYMRKLPVVGDILDSIITAGHPLPTFQIMHHAYFSKGFLLFITYQAVPEAHDIFKRFANVFEQTYTRFLDLQKAEAQARDAQIEMAVERVRAEAMAMHSTHDFGKVTRQLLKQIKIFDPDRFTGASICLIDEDQFFSWWDFSSPGSIANPESSTYRYDAKKYKVLGIDILKKWQVGESYIIFEFDLEQLHAATKEWEDINMDIANVFKEVISSGKLRHQWNPAGRLSNGFLTFDMVQPPDDDVRKITIKMAHAFEQAYTRFRDLQKAEAQAREAQIEAALERVRSRTMAMQSSSELGNVAAELFAQMNQLVTNLWTCGFVLCEKNRDEDEWWLSMDGDFTRGFFLPNIGDYAHATLYEGWLKGDALRAVQLDGETLQQHYDWLMEIPVSRAIFEEMDTAGLVRPDWQKLHAAYFSKGYLVLITREPCGEEEIFKRFAQVFDQTYTRFLDLKKAEAQSLEAIKRASVDRVRAEIASMRTITDLDRIQPLIWNELKILGVPFTRCGVFIMDEEKQEVESFLSTPYGKSIAAFRLSYSSTEQSKQIVAHWQQKQLFKDHMDEAAFTEFTKKLVQQGAVASDEKYVTENRPTDLYLHFLPFLQGMLYVGNSAPLKEDELQLVQNLAGAFSTAYARYEDFNKLEAAKAAVDLAMGTLKATQAQLVQQEKLASLGQLTAGIAHEIKNPLNFVNNFTEVSIELMEEALEEIQKNEDQKDKSLINHNLEDIKSNLKKVHGHSTRANSIVNSMLMHSRAGTGNPEPTLLNDFIREYCNLAFHGMRAGNNPLNVYMILNLDEKVKEIPIIAEDFSRVVLNICNNAFDAMRNTPKPMLTIHTQLQKDTVLLQFKDNGPGIPDEIKDKILQPFFTTKKGKEGTGLGLSITNDIVKAHRGELTIASQPGQGATFIIHLPI